MMTTPMMTTRMMTTPTMTPNRTTTSPINYFYSPSMFPNNINDSYLYNPLEVMPYEDQIVEAKNLCYDLSSCSAIVSMNGDTSNIQIVLDNVSKNDLINNSNFDTYLKIR
jgi:hypothetical protein